MRCTPSHLFLPYLAVGILLHLVLVVCLAGSELIVLASAQNPFPLTNPPQVQTPNDTGSARIPSFEVAGSVIQFENAAFWRSASWRIGLALGVVGLQSLLIVGLLFERSRKIAAARALTESEERYRDVVETQTELICCYLPDTTLTFVNDAYCRYFGKTRDELIGVQYLTLIPETARDQTRQHVESLIANPKVEINEHEVIRADGSIGWQQWVDHVIRREGIIELQGIGRDITDRKQAEQKLMVSEEFNRRIVESSSDCVKVLDLEGNLIYMSERGQRLLEVDDIGRLIGSSWVDLWQGSDRSSAREAVEKARNGDIGSFRGFARTLKEAPRWWHTVISPMRGTSGNVERLVAVSRDVTNQELALQALQKSEERFAKSFRGNPQPMWLTTLDKGTYIDVNESFLQMSGYSRDEIIGHTSSELNVYETSFSRQVLLVEPLSRFGSVHNIEINFRTKSGEFRVLLSSAELLELNGNQCILVASSDISERKVLEQNLRLSEREFSTLVQNSPDIIARLDRNLRYIYISPTFEKITTLKISQFIGRTPREISFPEYDWRDFEGHCHKAIETKKTVTRAVDFRGKKYWTRIIPEFSEDGIVESLMTITEDFTDRVRSEQELARLTVQLFNLQDEERRRIARELHDGSAQNLFAVSLNLAKIGQVSQLPEDAYQLINECQSLCDQSLQEIRTLSYLLHPPLLDHAGLVSALRWYVEGFTKRSGIYVNVFSQHVERRLPADIEMAFFRIVQEALTNVRRHSSSQTASIRLEQKPDEVVLEIKDQGHGLPDSTTQRDSDSHKSMGVGIPGMRQRLVQLGGSLEITSTELGTTISAVVPLRNGEHHVKNSIG